MENVTHGDEKAIDTMLSMNRLNKGGVSKTLLHDTDIIQSVDGKEDTKSIVDL